MILFDAYKYLFYRIYASQLRWFGEDDLPEFTAVISVSLLLGANIYAILIAISEWTTFSIVNPLYPDKFKAALVLLFLIGINSFIFLRNKYYKEIAKQFENESIFKRRIQLLFIFAYVIFSGVLVFII